MLATVPASAASAARGVRPGSCPRSRRVARYAGMCARRLRLSSHARDAHRARSSATQEPPRGEAVNELHAAYVVCSILMVRLTSSMVVHMAMSPM